MCGRYFLDDTEEANERLLNLLRGLLESGDPLDVLVLSSEVIQPLSLVRCYPIGVITMLDQGRLDAVSYTHLDVYKRQPHSSACAGPA